MAASIRNVGVLQFPCHVITTANSIWRVGGQKWRHFSSTHNTNDPDEGFLPDHNFSSNAQSLATRGYLRSQKPYSPPSNVAAQVKDICKKVLQNSNSKTSFGDAHTKHKVLTQCFRALNHSVPNSLLHKITNVGELVAFYKTEVDTIFPLDRFKTQDLPKNLHVTYNYTRFHPETDTKFGGVSVFTKDSTIVSGIKTKKKYQGYMTPSKWPYN